MVMTVDSSYNSVTGHPTSIFWGFFLTSKIHIPYLPGVLGILWGRALLLCSHGLTPNHGIPHTHACTSNLGHTTTNPPPDNPLAPHPASTALVPGGAMCTAGMAMLGSAIQPLGCMLHVSKFGLWVNFRTKP